ncbi:hypothetical protein QAD02_004520 [Eretmocerus hayati]|uniref:Uncharacterized protein n=1 Tax=Eretmocerus hayati TaxID=131215 RepID=A0ACC2NR04_9HYME|nr:hypothetical protein QAD02_004520 [Eretmocerus hayati]
MRTRSQTLKRTESTERDPRKSDVCSIKIISLNDDCLRHIFNFLNASDVLNVELVCKRFNLMSQEFWKTLRTFDIASSDLLDRASAVSPIERYINIPLCKRILTKCWNSLTKINLSMVEEFESRTIIDRTCHVNPYLHVLNFSTVSSEPLINIGKLSYCENIKELWLCHSVIDIDDKNFEQIFQRNKKLRFLSLNRYWLTGKCFSFLPLQTLESLFITNCFLVDARYLNSVIHQALNLQTLCLSKLKIMDQYKLIIASHCLKRLNLDYMSSLSFKVVGNVTVLSFAGCRLNDEGLRKIIALCKKLTSLDISANQDLTDISLGHLNSLTHLKYLSMSLIKNFTDEGLLLLNQNLQFLNVAGTSFSKRALLTVLERMQSLEGLDIAYCKQLRYSFVKSVKNIVELRPNGIALVVGIYRTSIEEIGTKEESPLVRLIPKLRPDFKKY